jgi:hypothetical protein
MIYSETKNVVLLRAYRASASLYMPGKPPDTAATSEAAVHGAHEERIPPFPPMSFLESACDKPVAFEAKPFSIRMELCRRS